MDDEGAENDAEVLEALEGAIAELTDEVAFFIAEEERPEISLCCEPC